VLFEVESSGIPTRHVETVLKSLWIPATVTTPYVTLVTDLNGGREEEKGAAE